MTCAAYGSFQFGRNAHTTPSRLRPHMGYLLLTEVAAWAVYAKFGVALLRNAWLNLDLLWAIALIATACLTVASTL